MLLGIIWLSTVFIQIPQHNILATGFDPVAYRVLVISNWIRTLAWVIRGILLLGMIANLL